MLKSIFIVLGFLCCAPVAHPQELVSGWKVQTTGDRSTLVIEMLNEDTKADLKALVVKGQCPEAQVKNGASCHFWVMRALFKDKALNIYTFRGWDKTGHRTPVATLKPKGEIHDGDWTCYVVVPNGTVESSCVQKELPGLLAKGTDLLGHGYKISSGEADGFEAMSHNILKLANELSSWDKAGR